MNKIYKLRGSSSIRPEKSNVEVPLVSLKRSEQIIPYGVDFCQPEGVDLEKIARRLAHILDLREQKPSEYASSGLAREKESIYILYPEAVPMARKYTKRA